MQCNADMRHNHYPQHYRSATLAASNSTQQRELISTLTTAQTTCRPLARLLTCMCVCEREQHSSARRAEVAALQWQQRTFCVPPVIHCVEENRVESIASRVVCVALRIFGSVSCGSVLLRLATQRHRTFSTTVLYCSVQHWSLTFDLCGWFHMAELQRLNDTTVELSVACPSL